jgi:hypothetical protein
MPLSQYFPTSALDYAEKAAEQEQVNALRQMRVQAEQNDMTNKRRSIALSILNGLDGNPEAERLYATIKPMAERYDPTLKLPDAYDPMLTKALTASQSPAQPMTAYQKAQIDALTERNAIARERMSAKDSGKALPVSAIKDLEKKAVGFEDMSRLSSGFKPEFSGNTVTGGLENFVGRLGGEKLGLTDEGQTQWWQDYQGYVNQVRNDLFGAALTPGEKAEFEKAIITPNMDPEQAAANLARQQALTQNALARSGNVYRMGGYNDEQIGQFAPESVTRVDTTSPTLGKLKVGTEEDGYVYLGGDPADQKSWKKR